MKVENEEKLIEALKKNHEIQSDKESVLVSQMKFDALKALADPTKDIFSQVSIAETHLFEVATLFAHDPCSNINTRLSAKLKSIGKSEEEVNKLLIRLPILEEYIYGLLAHRLRVDRKRVKEYIEMAQAITPKMNDLPPQPKNSLLQRLV